MWYQGDVLHLLCPGLPLWQQTVSMVGDGGFLLLHLLEREKLKSCLVDFLVFKQKLT